MHVLLFRRITLANALLYSTFLKPSAGGISNQTRGNRGPDDGLHHRGGNVSPRMSDALQNHTELGEQVIQAIRHTLSQAKSDRSKNATSPLIALVHQLQEHGDP